MHESRHHSKSCLFAWLAGLDGLVVFLALRYMFNHFKLYPGAMCTWSVQHSSLQLVCQPSCHHPSFLWADLCQALYIEGIPAVVKEFFEWYFSCTILLPAEPLPICPSRWPSFPPLEGKLFGKQLQSLWRYRREQQLCRSPRSQWKYFLHLSHWWHFTGFA